MPNLICGETTMTNETFTSGGKTYNMTINPAPTDGKKYPVIFLIHGNAGLVAPFGDQIHGFAKDLADLGYLTVVPEYYNTNHPPNLGDRTPHNQTLADAISAISTRLDVDLDRLGLIGFSLGAATAMTYIASNPIGTVKVLANFFGFLAPEIKREEVAKFPPTIILHNGDDKIVDISYSNELNILLENANIKHQFEVYDEDWRVNYHGLLVEVDHSFKPGDSADVDSRKQTTNWFVNHLPPIGK
jgi:dienelactone hydrolase